MKTLTPPTTTAPSRSQGTVPTPATRKPAALTARPSRPSRPLRQLAVAGIVLSLAALGACSSDASDTGPSASATPGATSPAPGTSVPTSPAATTTTPARADKTVKVQLKDDILGHVVTATKLSRNIPWPAGNPVAAASFEIVGVQLTVDAGDRYSADVKPSMFTLKPGAAAPVTPTPEFDKTLGAPLDTTKRAQKKTGWLFFKVDRGSSGALQLTFNRPAYTVKTTGKAIKAAAFSKPIG